VPKSSSEIPTPNSLSRARTSPIRAWSDMIELSVMSMMSASAAVRGERGCDRERELDVEQVGDRRVHGDVELVAGRKPRAPRGEASARTAQVRSRGTPAWWRAE
jgi:hypothetical protein